MNSERAPRFVALLCRLGWHDWRYVGEQREFAGIGGFGWSSWNHECPRCHRTSWRVTL